MGETTHSPSSSSSSSCSCSNETGAPNERECTRSRSSTSTRTRTRTMGDRLNAFPMSPPAPNPDLEQTIFRALRKAIFLGVGLYVLVEFLGAVTFLVLFFGLVFLMAAALNPVVAWLQRRRIPRPVSARR